MNEMENQCNEGLFVPEEYGDVYNFRLTDKGEEILWKH